MFKPSLLAALVLAAFIPGAAWSAPTAEQQELEQLRATTQSLIQALVEQGLISRERADALLRQAAAKTPAPAQAPAAPAAPTTAAAPAAPQPAAAAASGVVRVPYVSETLRAQIKEEVKNDVLYTAREERWADARQVPNWVRGITIDGDIRLRAQGDVFDQGNLPAEAYRTQVDSPAWSPDLTNTQNSRKRLTLRARLGLQAKVSEDVAAGLRITTGGVNNQASQSQTLGTNFNRAALGLDRAFVRWEPRHYLRFEGGRIANPFFGTDLLWPDDLSLDGVTARAERDLAPGLMGFVVAGSFPLEEFALTKGDKWLHGLQVGADWYVNDRTLMRVGLGYYDFQNVEGVRESQPPPGGSRAGTVPYQTSQYPSSVRQRGNTLINLNDPSSTAAPVWGLASKFKPFNLSAGVTFTHFDPVQVGLSFDYVKNSAFDLADIRQRAGTTSMDDLAAKTTGVQLRAQVGSLKLAEPGNWQAFLAYRKFERDAWVDAFTDTTWHLGGTNYKGFSVGGGYAIDRGMSLGVRWTSTRNLDDGSRFLMVPGDPSSLSGNLSSAPLKIDVLQVEINSRF
ncbi:MAG: hypothetical protein RLZZ618_3107 [Pseudomonadota bacterium]|jgi:hypothetical protein